MISSRSFIKFLSYTDDEVDKYIANMTEKDAKETLAAMIKTMNIINRKGYAQDNKTE